MKYLINKTKLIAILVITILLVVLGILNLRDRLATPSVADDGVEWVNTANGVQAKSVRTDAHIAVKKGDYLRAIFYQGKYEEIDSAETVIVVTVDAKPRLFGHGEHPGANIAAHLSRRGKHVEVRNVDGAGKPVSAALIEQARAINADLIVMGGYASSRLREMVFGGATRDLLRKSEAPLLMSH